MAENKQKSKIKEEKDPSYKKIKKDLKKRFKKEKKSSFRNAIWKTKGFSNKLNKLNNHLGKYKYGFEKSRNIIELVNVQKYYENDKKAFHALRDINIKIPYGKTVSILGPSGSGKTTLLNIISGLIGVEKGDVIISSRNLTFFNDKKRTKFREEEISFVFQRYNLLKTLKCKDNILLGSDLSSYKKDHLSIEKIAKILNIEKQLNKYPYQLSGGQQQRISIGRAIIKNPSLLLADEPTGALDEHSARIVWETLININKELSTSIVVVTHNSNIAKITDYIIKVRNGRIDEFIKNDNKISPKDMHLGV